MTGIATSSLPGRPSSLLLEIGCYTGEYLSRIASKYPNVYFIELDWKARPLFLGAELMAPRQLANLALLRGRAQELTAMFADGELDEIWLFHPEPCDREKERRNRLVSETFLADVGRVLRAGGRFVLKTDHCEYFDWTCALLQQERLASLFRIEHSSSDFWNDPFLQSATSALAFVGEATAFEQRFIKRKQPIHFLSVTHHP